MPGLLQARVSDEQGPCGPHFAGQLPESRERARAELDVRRRMEVERLQGPRRQHEVTRRGGGSGVHVFRKSVGRAAASLTTMIPERAMGAKGEVTTRGQ